MQQQRLVIAALFLVFSLEIRADLIVDTGTPVVDWATWTFRETQYFAGEFSILDAYTITSAESYFSNAGDGDKIDTGLAGDVEISIHADSGYLPGPVVFSTTVSIDQDAPLGWYGAYGLDWSLEAGTYWLSFVPDAKITGVMPGVAPNPFEEYAQGNSGTWGDFGPNNFDYLGIGFRVDATTIGVPEPGTFALLGIGLAGVGLSRRRRQAA